MESDNLVIRKEKSRENKVVIKTERLQNKKRREIQLEKKMKLEKKKSMDEGVKKIKTIRIERERRGRKIKNKINTHENYNKQG